MAYLYFLLQCFTCTVEIYHAIRGIQRQYSCGCRNIVVYIIIVLFRRFIGLFLNASKNVSVWMR